MLTIKNKNNSTEPFFSCDHCKEIISDITEATASWRVKTPPKPIDGQVFTYHKKCLDIVDSPDSDKKRSWEWSHVELTDYIEALIKNI